MKGKQLLIAVLILGVLGAIAYFISIDDQGGQGPTQRVLAKRS